MEGIAISAQRINETYTGTEQMQVGVFRKLKIQQIHRFSYLEGNKGTVIMKKSEETINYEVNRIQKEIVESPYKIRDLGIQVMVEPPNADRSEFITATNRSDDITNILGTIVRTSIDKNVERQDLTDEAINQKIAVSVQPFKGKVVI